VSVYKPCDIRGLAGSELTPELYRRWGRGLGLQLPPAARVAVGGDVRSTTPAFLDALAGGLVEAGAEVIDLGIVPTPMVYFAKFRLQLQACAIVTASHNPPGMNGLKWMIGDMPVQEEDVQRLRRFAEDGPEASARRRGRRVREDITGEYLQWLRHELPPGGQAGGRIAVLDPGNGSWSGRAGRYLGALLPGTAVRTIHDVADGSFPDRGPDCVRPACLHALGRAVRDCGAALGVAFDGDGDRVAFVDDQGAPLTAEETVWVLLDALGPQIRGRRLVFDLKFSDLVARRAAEHGGQPLRERSGHAFIRSRMLREQALFGAEISGHYFHGCIAGADDSLFTACRMIAHLASAGRPLSRLRRDCPPTCLTPDLRVPVEPGRREQLIENVKRAFADRPQTLIDGVRVDFEDGWGMIRGSVTEAKLTLRFEAPTPERLEAIVRSFARPLGDVGERLLEHYRRAIAGETEHERDA